MEHYQIQSEFTKIMYSIIEQNMYRLSESFSLRPYVDNDLRIVVDIICINSHIGYVVIGNLNDNGFVRISCRIDRLNEYVTQLYVNTIDQIFEIIQFCQQLLIHQPDEDKLE